MVTRLIRDNDGQLRQHGVVDSAQIPQRKLNIMSGLHKKRLKLTTGPEKKFCFALQVLVWGSGGLLPFQREKVVHLSDILSRSLDFYFSICKLGVEIDGRSHRENIQAAKDEWTDRLFAEAGVKILRFSNDEVLESIHLVIDALLQNAIARHNWPPSCRLRLENIRRYAATAELWRDFCSRFLDFRSCQRSAKRERPTQHSSSAA
jgi:hypothetical protein